MWLLALLGGCVVQAVVIDPNDSGSTPDTDDCLVAPIIDHDPVQGPINVNEDLLLDITAYDYDGLTSVEVRYRPQNTEGWRTLEADPVAGNRWQAVIDHAYLEVGMVEYFIRAFDSCGDKGCAPAECQGNPWTFEVISP